MRIIRKFILFVGICLCAFPSLFARQTVTLGDAIRIVQSNSFDAQLPQFSFLKCRG